MLMASALFAIPRSILEYVASLTCQTGAVQNVPVRFAQAFFARYLKQQCSSWILLTVRLVERLNAAVTHIPWHRSQPLAMMAV